MINIRGFIENIVPAWKAARAYVMCYDNIDNPPEIDPNDGYWAEQISNIGIDGAKYRIFFDVSDNSWNSLGYGGINVFLRSDKSVICAEFEHCTESFLNTTRQLGMVNGMEYKTRKKVGLSEVFFF